MTIAWKPIGAMPADRKDGRPMLVAQDFDDGTFAYAVAKWDRDSWRDDGDRCVGGMDGADLTHWADINPTE